MPAVLKVSGSKTMSGLKEEALSKIEQASFIFSREFGSCKLNGGANASKVPIDDVTILIFFAIIYSS